MPADAGIRETPFLGPVASWLEMDYLTTDKTLDPQFLLAARYSNKLIVRGRALSGVAPPGR